jgi:hypothetical protein
MRISLFPQGTRIRIRRDRIPLDPRLPGRLGLVVGHDRDVPGRVWVQLDGEERFRVFVDEELESVRRVSGPEEAGSPGPTISASDG